MLKLQLRDIQPRAVANRRLFQTRDDLGVTVQPARNLRERHAEEVAHHLALGNYRRYPEPIVERSVNECVKRLAHNVRRMSHVPDELSNQPLVGEMISHLLRQSLHVHVRVGLQRRLQNPDVHERSGERARCQIPSNLVRLHKKLETFQIVQRVPKQFRLRVHLDVWQFRGKLATIGRSQRDYYGPRHFGDCRCRALGREKLTAALAIGELPD